MGWGEHYSGEGIDDFVWVLQISGAAPANHFNGGYAGASRKRQPAMYIPLCGGSLKGVSKPGSIVWSRVFVELGALHIDIGIGTVVSLPTAETDCRWRETTHQWPIMHAIFPGISGTFGSRLFLPELYDGRDDSFFFVSVQETLVHQRPNAMFCCSA